MSNFEKAYQRTMGNEGGYANNPRDNGGETYKGISRKNWPRWNGWPIVDGIKSNMVKQPVYGTSSYYEWARYINKQLAGSPLLQKSVAEFYRQNFWGYLDQIEDQRLAEEIFDKRVNCGDVAARWIQRAAGVAADGIIGPKSIDAINAADPATLLAAFNESAGHYYKGIIERDPTQSVFWKSWTGRLKNYDDTPYVA